MGASEHEPDVTVDASSDRVSATTPAVGPLVVVSLAVLAAVLVVLPSLGRSGGGTPVDPIDVPVAPPPLAAVPDADERERKVEAAIATVQSLVLSVNRADSVRVIELLSPAVQQPDAGHTEWPLTFGDIGWWNAESGTALLDETQVSEFVRYFRALPGGLILGSCGGRIVDAVDVDVLVECRYTAFGGIRGLMGRRDLAETGRLMVAVDGSVVTGVRHSSELNDRAWSDLAAWAAALEPGGLPQSIGAVEQHGLVLEPTYTSVTAIEHTEAAIAFARANGATPLPIG